MLLTYSASGVAPSPITGANCIEAPPALEHRSAFGEKFQLPDALALPAC